jgi:Na+(H+)/acetate symporter ActP
MGNLISLLMFSVVHIRGIITEGLLALLVTYASSVQLQAHYPESLVTIFYKAVHETAAVHLEV